MVSFAAPRRTESAVAVRILAFGVLSAEVDGHPADLGPLKQRMLLALLLSRPGAETPSEELIAALWNSPPPASAANNLRTYVHGLRRALGKDVIAGNGRPGYRLRAGLRSIDIVEFEASCRDAEAALTRGDHRAAYAALAAAVALRRGPAFTDLRDLRAVDAEAARLEERWLLAMEQRLELDLGRGRAAELVGELTTLADGHPYRERLISSLMLALYRSGRQTEALAVYRRTAATLARELAVEPGPDLADLHRAILRQDVGLELEPAVAAPPAPAQLPADVAGFTGREDSLRTLDLHAGRHGGPPVGVSAVVGTAGVGKTALARRWAHRVRDRYPDGQLFVDLRGFADEAPLRPLEVLGTFLRALGVTPDQVPTGLDEAAAAYRTRLAERRMLIVLDNARSAAQVRPLLPGGSHSHVIVTSRDSLTGLVAVDGARLVILEPLTSGQARRLLIALLGERRVLAEVAAAEALAESCAYLPLALRIVCAQLSSRPGARLADKVAALNAENRLVELAVPGDDQPGMAAALRHSYDALTPAAQRLFRLLGIAGVHDVTGQAAAALAGQAQDAGQPLLDSLAAAHLIEEHRPGRYAFHDVLRTYAAGLAAAVDGVAEREEATVRLLDWYAARAGAADRLLYPHIWRMTDATPPPATGPAFDRATALRWLDDERSNIVASARNAATRGARPQAWRIADATRGYVWYGAHLAEWHALAEAGRDAAERLGDQYAQAAMSQSLAFLATNRRDPKAVDAYRTALDLSRAAGWREGEALALGNLGRDYSDRGRLTRAAECLEQALTIDIEVGPVSRLAVHTGSLGIVMAEAGRLDRAADLHSRALTIFRDLGNRVASATALNNLANAHWAMGRLDLALPLVRESITLHRDAGSRVGEAFGLGLLAVVTRDLGDTDQALGHARSALTLIRTAGDDRNQGEILNILGSLHLIRDDPRTALNCYRQAAVCARQAAAPLPAVQALVGLATVEHQLGRWVASWGLARRALVTSRKHGYRLVAGHAWTVQAQLQLSRGRPAAARQAAGQALRVQHETGHRIKDADPAPVLARLRLITGRQRS